VSLEPFYDSLPDQSMNTYEIALDDVNTLEGRSLLDLANSYGSVWDLQAQSTRVGRAFADDLQAARSNTQRRRSACRDAIVDWLYSRDAVNPPGVDRDGILQDQRGCFFAEPFTADDLDAAAAWLHRQGLAGGTMIAEAQGPGVLYLTDYGVKCAEDFSSDTGAYLERQQHRASGPTVNIGTNSAPFQVAGDYANRDSRDLVRSARPDLPDGPGFWLAMAGVFAALGIGAITIAVTEYHPPWTSAWFITGAVLSTLGCMCAIWSLVLYLARNQAASHWCPDPQAHDLQTAQTGARTNQITEEKLQLTPDKAQENPISPDALPYGGKRPLL